MGGVVVVMWQDPKERSHSDEELSRSRLSRENLTLNRVELYCISIGSILLRI